jgi:hypothetical protein
MKNKKQKKHCNDPKCNCQRATEILNDFFSKVWIEFSKDGVKIIKKDKK